MYGSWSTFVPAGTRSSICETKSPSTFQAAAIAGLAGDGSADLLALPYARRHPDEAALAASVDAVLSLNPPRGAFRRIPHFHHATIDDLWPLVRQSAAEQG